MSKRSNSRKLAMRMLYQLDIRSETALDVIFEEMDTAHYAPETLDWAQELASCTWQNISTIDDLIQKLSIDWEPDRLNLVDKALLRIGIAEIKYVKTPHPIVINEILELSKEFSTDESSKFINGILNEFAKQTCSQD